MLMHVSAISTLDWYCISILTLLVPEEENSQKQKKEWKKPHLLNKVQVSTAKKKRRKKKSGRKKISICNKLLCMAKCNLPLCAVFKWSLMYVGKKVCLKVKMSERKELKWASALYKKKMCCACYFWIETKWKSRCSVVILTVLRPF